MSLNLEQLLTVTPCERPTCGATTHRRPVTESEVVGLAVQLLIKRGAEERESNSDVYGWQRVYLNHEWTKGRYLVVPLSALEDNDGSKFAEMGDGESWVEGDQ